MPNPSPCGEMWRPLLPTRALYAPPPMPTLHVALAVAATLVAVAFAFSTWERWLTRRRPQELTWTIALAMFAVAAGALAAGAQLGWSGPAFRTFYLFGAILNVPWLALGTVQLLAGERVARNSLRGVVVLSAFAAGCLLVAPFTASLPRDELARGSEVFGPVPRILAAIASGGGALVVLGGAVWSAVRARGRRAVISNTLIAAGTLITGASGLLNSALDEMTAFAVTLVAGIAVIFVGFLVAAASGPATSEARAAAPSRSPRAAPGR